MSTQFSLTTALLDRFNKDGYVLVRSLFDEEETDLLLKIAKADRAFTQEAKSLGETRIEPGTAPNLIKLDDGEGGESKIWLSNELQDHIFSAFVRCPRVVDTMEKLLDGEVYHYHHKMMLKEPLIGGAWGWHQDYGYWYQNGCLFPYMASCMIAVDRATKQNGCLQVIQGSHHMGRIEHGRTGDQTGADLERVEVALERMPLVHVEMDPGDALFFHGNLLHRSDPNKSPDPRWSLICCYNAARNDPYKESVHPRYSQLEKWPDSRIKEVGRRQWAAMQSAVGA